MVNVGYSMINLKNYFKIIKNKEPKETHKFFIQIIGYTNGVGLSKDIELLLSLIKEMNIPVEYIPPFKTSAEGVDKICNEYSEKVGHMCGKLRTEIKKYSDKIEISLTDHL